MRQKLSLVVALALVSPVMAQSTDTLDGLWNFQDAVPTPAGQTDIRFSFGWETGTFGHGSGDDLIATPSLYWGMDEGYELSLSMPAYVGDGGNRSGYADGNYDTYMGLLARLQEQEGDGAAIALAVNLRIPTGNNSEKVDAEARLIATHDYGDSGVRTHCNLFVTSANGGNNHGDSGRGMLGMGRFIGNRGSDNTRDLQFGAVLGADGPLCDDGAVRWVFDYMHRSSMNDGENNWNVAEVGWEWMMNESDRLGLSVQVNLDRSTDASDVGAIMSFAHAMTY